MDWKKYEEVIHQYFVNEFPTSIITKNAHIVGRFSKVERQIDVLIEEVTSIGFRFQIIIDAKHRTRPIDVTDVESFIGFCADIGAHKGILISLNGYTVAAINRVHNDESDIELDVLNFKDLEEFQGHFAFPYSGKNGVLLSAPFGWVIDATQREGAVAALYQRGYDLKLAGKAKEWMYINFWSKNTSVASIDELIQLQNSLLLKDFPTAKITYIDSLSNASGSTKIRCFVESSYPSIEYTGFVEFDDFIFFCVLFSSPELAKRNLRKLDYILRTVKPIVVTNVEPCTT